MPLTSVLTMVRPSKRTLALRALNSRKKQKVITPESDHESEIEESPINFPDLPDLKGDDMEGIGENVEDVEGDAFMVLRNSTRDWNDLHLAYQRTNQPSRQTLWRQQRRRDELQVAAAGSRDIRSMFNNVQIPVAIPPVEVSTPKE